MKIFTLIITCFFIIQVYSQELITDRPDITESPYIVPQNHLQFEHGLSYSWGTIKNSFDPTFDVDYNVLQIASTLVRYGINDMVELRLEFNPTVSTIAGESITGLPPMGLGIKSKLFTGDGAIPQIAILATAYPGLLATENMQPEVAIYEYRMAANHIFTEWWSVGWNFGAIISSITSPQYVYSLSSGFAINEKAGCFVEAYGNFPANKLDANVSDNLFLDAGFTYGFTPMLQADLSFGYELTNINAYYSFGIGFSYLISLKKSDG
ncbi:MAG: transporter [Chitinophagales bacterium]|nr:transporter [Bacteroidota bacterium]MBP9703607.1 transporter [Chitinophagales bacterium]